MEVSTYHTHTNFSDGKNTHEEMLKKAIQLGMREYGFSDHAPMIFPCSWSMKQEDESAYKSIILELKERYKDQIKVYLGIEQDYYSTPASGYDYLIGSVHYIEKNGVYLPLDESPAKTRENVEKYYGGDALAYCEDYYKLVADLYNKTKCHIIGHLDLITKFNEIDPIIDTTHPRYIKAYKEAIEKLKSTPVIYEINTGAISRGYRKSPYPSDEMIDIIASQNKPFVICSDTHSTSTIDTNLESEKQRLKDKGYTYITALSDIL
ncbi:MAG: histidinol-phosphatase [Clostridia bacterium]|nr:histidinol-phosphatase [Clostridia bacterium]